MKKLNPRRITVEALARQHSTEEIDTLIAKLQAAHEERQSTQEEAKFKAIQHFLDHNEHEITALDVMHWVDLRRSKLRQMATQDCGYVHPHDPSLVWIGKGRRPLWVSECLARGYTLEQLSRNPPPPVVTVSREVTDPVTGKTWNGQGRPPNWVKIFRAAPPPTAQVAETEQVPQAAAQARGGSTP